MGNGVFEVPFDGKWCAIDSEIFSCELKDGGLYGICIIPIMIEGNNYGENYEYYKYKFNEKVISPVITESEGTKELVLNIQEIDLENRTEAKYEIQGRAWDLKSQIFYTGTMERYSQGNC